VERVLRIAAENGFHQWEGAWLRKDHSRFQAWVGILAMRRLSGTLRRYQGDYPRSELWRLL